MKALTLITKAWQALMVATIIATVLFLCSSCGESIANNEQYEDAYCLAEGQGIVLQEVYFVNGQPYLYGKPVDFTQTCETIINKCFNDDTYTLWQYPIAAVCWQTSWDTYIVDID